MKRFLWLIILVLFMPIIYAKAYDINNYYINANLEKDGDLVVEEYLDLNGSFNGFERIINYKNEYSPTFIPLADKYGGSNIHNGSNVDIIEVASVNIDDNFKFDGSVNKKFKEVESAEAGDYGVYTVASSMFGKTVRMYLPSRRHEAFYIKYKIRDIAILHDDVGELGWNVVGKAFTESVGHLVLKLTINNNKDLLKVWGHGPANGITSITLPNSIDFQIDGLNNYTSVDVRLAFDKEAIPNCTKMTHVNALDKIIAYENELAEEANRKREEIAKRAEDNVIEIMAMLKEHPTRERYDRVLTAINNLANEKKETYTEELISLQPMVDDYEYNEYLLIYNKEYKITYKDYKSAKSYIDNVFSEETKAKMKKGIANMKKRVIRNELGLDLGITIIIGAIISLSYGYKLLLKILSLRKKSYNQIDYLRELPGKLSPSAAGLLIDKRLSKDEIAATILDLINRKIISFKKLDDGSYDITCIKKDDTDYGKRISGSEQDLISLLFKRKSTINTKHMPRFDYDSYNSWKKSVVKELEKRDLIKDYINNDEVNIGEIILGFILLAMSPIFTSLTPLTTVIMAVAGVFLIIDFFYKRYQERFILWINYPILAVLIFLSLFVCHYIHVSIIFAIIGMIITHKILYMVPNRLKFKVTKKGKEEYIKWNAFKSFLLDFTRIDIRDINEIVLWEQYLIYATALGVSKTVIDRMKVKIESLNINSDILVTSAIFSSISDISVINDSLNYVSSVATKASIPTIHVPDISSGSDGGSWSSGSGDGGGFSGGSSGGGSFGGGGGGGRF